MTNTNSSLLKSPIAVIAVLALLVTTGCRTTNVSGKGGVVTLNEEFTITVPAEIALKQGAEVPLTVLLNRGAYFKRDVQLDIKVAGISVTPGYILVNASDRPEVQLKLAAPRDAALGDYRVAITGTPTTGKPVAAVTIVKVLAQ